MCPLFVCVRARRLRLASSVRDSWRPLVGLKAWSARAYSHCRGFAQFASLRRRHSLPIALAPADRSVTVVSSPSCSFLLFVSLRLLARISSLYSRAPAHPSPIARRPLWFVRRLVALTFILLRVSARILIGRGSDPPPLPPFVSIRLASRPPPLLVLVPPRLPLRVVCPRRLPPSLHSPSSPRPFPDLPSPPPRPRPHVFTHSACSSASRLPPDPTPTSPSSRPPP